ncbi:MAG: hypothetical protein U1A77_24840 [Pirellulales bacterium]
MDLVEDLPLVVGHIPGVAASDEQFTTNEKQLARGGDPPRVTRFDFTQPAHKLIHVIS